MGCDIHFNTEVRENGVWKTADKWFRDEDDNSRMTQYQWGEGFKKKASPMYTGRNYDLFSILANVRNGYGFAGVYTGEGFIPICEPRGLPDDASPEVLQASEDWGVDGHSHSHLTVAEMLAYDWTQVTTKRGWVGMKEFARWHLDGRPKSWSGAISGGGIEHLSLADMLGEMQSLAEGEMFNWRDFHNIPEDNFESKKYCQVKWTVPYYDAAGSFLSEVMPQLWRLGSPEDVRIVFWFDN